jgi:C4-type Zn-finger protein
MTDIRDQERTKDCPVCGELMRIRTHERIDRIPGMTQHVKRTAREWNCPDCSYEEDVEDGD